MSFTDFQEFVSQKHVALTEHRRRSMILAMRKTIGKLNCLVRPGENSKKVVVLLHGFGADAADLFPLADYLDNKGEYHFVFPEAPLEVPIGPMMSGRGWFPLSVRELQGGFDFTALRPPNMDASVEAVRDLIFHLEPESLVLGGFSQGAMICTEVAMLDYDVVKGLVLYSGTLLDETGWRKKAAALKDMPVLMSHGVRDPVLPIAYAQRLFEILKSAGAKVQMTEFPGGHEIPPAVLNKTQVFIQSILGE